MATVKQDSSPIRPPNFRIEIPGDEKVSPATTKPVGGNGVLFQEISLKNSTGKATVAVWDSLVDTIQKGKVINISKCRVRLFNAEKKLSTTKASVLEGCENRILFAQNVRSTVTCLECDKPRCVYSKLKDPRDKSTFATIFCIGSPVPQQPSVSTDSVTLASTATQQRQSKELEAKRIRLKCLETEIEIRKQTAELEALLELKSAQKVTIC
ncbi:unnamed protein product [Mytilus edulis]|uniref:Uncharacterized protein n=1 Tax=Mytilus edulis TaxID=6550 RepID=A0A8S3V2L9_MYTED|nr:unnamed protein product [Mytilus edulis]